MTRTTAPPHRHQLPTFGFGFDRFDPAQTSKIRRKQLLRVIRADVLVFGVEPPVGGDQIEVPIGVHVSRHHAVPPPAQGGQPRFGSGVAKSTGSRACALIHKNSQGSPFLSDRQIGPSIVIQIGPDRAIDQSQRRPG